MSAFTMQPETRPSAAFAGAPADAPEQYSGETLLVTAYAAIWLVLMAWIFLLWKKQAALGKRLGDLEAALDRAASRSAAGAGGASEARPPKPTLPDTPSAKKS